MKVSEEKLAKCRKSFKYWYPMDLRVSAKDLIRNHLIFSLFNHAAVWKSKGDAMIPRAFFCNGMILVDRGNQFLIFICVLSLYRTWPREDV